MKPISSLAHDIVIDLSLKPNKDDQYYSLLFEFLFVGNQFIEKRITNKRLAVLVYDFERRVMFDLFFDLKINYNIEDFKPQKCDYNICFIKDADDKRLIHYLLYVPGNLKKVFYSYFQFEDSSKTHNDFNYRQLINLAVDSHKVRRHDREIIIAATEFKLDFENGIWDINEDFDF